MGFFLNDRLAAGLAWWGSGQKGRRSTPAATLPKEPECQGKRLLQAVPAKPLCVPVLWPKFLP